MSVFVMASRHIWHRREKRESTTYNLQLTTDHSKQTEEVYFHSVGPPQNKVRPYQAGFETVSTCLTRRSGLRLNSLGHRDLYTPLLPVFDDVITVYDAGLSHPLLYPVHPSELWLPSEFSSCYCRVNM